MELWDAYDKDLNKIEGVTLVRGEESSISTGKYHLVCDIIVRHDDGDYLIMRRDLRKAYGGMWEATAGGAALQGESPMECARRELAEETGIRSEDLSEIGRVASDVTHSFYVEFFCQTDCDKDSVILQEGETIDYRWVSREELMNMGEDLLTSRIQDFVEELRG
ncbi:MAG: NUDIX hydrolase [Clostridiales bacterium]|nr:NUDIX hydrolase [Clostridiales bacterium]